MFFFKSETWSEDQLQLHFQKKHFFLAEMDFYKQHANELQTLKSSEANEDIRNVQTDPDAYFKRVIENGQFIQMVVSVLFPPRSFTYPLMG